MRSRRFRVFRHLSQITELSDVSLSMSINAGFNRNCEPMSGKIGFMKSTGAEKPGRTLSLMYVYSGVSRITVLSSLLCG